MRFRKILRSSTSFKRRSGKFAANPSVLDSLRMPLNKKKSPDSVERASGPFIFLGSARFRPKIGFRNAFTWVSQKNHSLPLRRKQFQQLPLPSRRSAIELRPLLATKLWKLPSEKQDYGRPQSAQASSLIRANSERFAVINVSLFRIACPAIRRS
jgi:hypothetical protein